MKTKTKNKATGKKTEEKYSDKLLQEVKEAKEDYKTGKYFKGTADDVIKNLHEEIK
jgi:hypothetical protein